MSWQSGLPKKYAGVERYAAIIEVASHILKRAIKFDTHALDNSRGVCEEDRPWIRVISVIGFNDVA